ncbi:uncharacterized protein BN796_00679 [Alistipes sp. CAG:831]|nr:uncharacterized protein BN796_00679 [Alistipes sp. CAG:831]
MSSFPLILQHDSMQCGVACLAMVCSHYGREYSLETLSKYCSPTAEGVSLLAISDAADGSCIRGQNRIPLQANQNAEAVILISDRSLIQMMLLKSP